jgi:hypothetical protein
MGLVVRYIGGPNAGDVVQFGDDVSRVTIGRDHTSCDVVVPAEYASVGRHHCAVRAVAGRYSLETDAEHPVFIGGRRAESGAPLPVPFVDIELGRRGPRLRLETQPGSHAAATLPDGRRATDPQPMGRTTAFILATDRRLVRQRRLTVAALLLAALAGVVGWVALSGAWEKWRLARALAAARASVYVVAVESPEQGGRALGTAWAVGDHLLATNAHVAEEFARRNGEQAFVALSSDVPPKRFAISRVEVHPGYGAFERLWNDYSPVISDERGTRRRLNHVAAYDVALLQVAGPEPLAPPLALADDQTLAAIGVGEPVGLVGYPIENMAYGQQNFLQPNPTIPTGEVRKLSDLFGRPAGGMFDLLMHSMETVGGASGSPILLPDGTVAALHSAGNVQDLGMQSGPALSPEYYAQNVRFLRELLEKTAAERTARRRAEWCAGLGGYARGANGAPETCPPAAQEK